MNGNLDNKNSSNPVNDQILAPIMGGSTDRKPTKKKVSMERSKSNYEKKNSKESNGLTREPNSFFQEESKKFKIVENEPNENPNSFLKHYLGLSPVLEENLNGEIIGLEAFKLEKGTKKLSYIKRISAKKSSLSVRTFLTKSCDSLIRNIGDSINPGDDNDQNWGKEIEKPSKISFNMEEKGLQLDRDLPSPVPFENMRKSNSFSPFEFMSLDSNDLSYAYDFDSESKPPSFHVILI